VTAAARRFTGLAVATLVAAAGLIGLSGAPASAALCSGTGVNVVVDHHQLGGGMQKACDPSGGNTPADQVFAAAGFTLTYAQQQPGFVCRVNGAPASDPCVHTSPANAYWGLYWSDGKSGKWVYATTGANGLQVPNGGFVAFSWQGSTSKTPPGVSPVNATPVPKPTPTPTPKPTKKANPKPAKTKASTSSSELAATASQAAGSASAEAASPTASPSVSPAASASAVPTASASVAAPTPTDSPSASGTPEAAVSANTKLTAADPDTGGLPLWVPAAVVVVLCAATGAVLWRRRATGGRPGA
jgi:hypothetical protein